MSWLDEIKAYEPQDAQEEKDQEKILQFCKNHDNALFRENVAGHFSSSGFIVNPARDKVLMVYHLIFQTYAWTGGHIDGEEDFLEVAIKEAMEETGLQKLTQLTPIIALDVLPVQAHIKNGQPVIAHDHFNVTYAFEADESQVLVVKGDENSDVKWIKIKELEKWVKEKEMIKVYQKILKRLI
ncbi:MAG: NUDIX hydrolase [Anaerorhabdus sp.]